MRDFVLIEDDVSTITAKLTPIPAKTRTVLAEGYKYTRNSKGEEQLFDLGADPDEMFDLAGREPVARARMMERLTDALIDADDAARERRPPADSRFSLRASSVAFSCRVPPR